MRDQLMLVALTRILYSVFYNWLEHLELYFGSICDAARRLYRYRKRHWLASSLTLLPVCAVSKAGIFCLAASWQAKVDTSDLNNS
jgi:hypothetical protein